MVYGQVLYDTPQHLAALGPRPEAETVSGSDPATPADDLDSVEGVDAPILRLYGQIDAGTVRSRDAGLRLRILHTRREALTREGPRRADAPII